MTGSQTITLSESVDDQKSGIEFVFSGYDPDEKQALDYYWNSCFFSKTALSTSGGKMCNMYDTQWVHKYLYIDGNKVKGADTNDDAPNNRFVLRRVIGI